jgi:hypothetical protein
LLPVDPLSITVVETAGEEWDVGRDDVEDERELVTAVTPGRTGNDGVEEDKEYSVLGGPSLKKASITYVSH